MDRRLAEICRETFEHDEPVTVREDGDGLIVCVRASKDSRDWVQNFLALPTKDRLVGVVHDGFLAEARQIMRQIAPALQGRRFVITGHSRGGAIALVLGGLLKGSGLVADAIVTFGAPRAGWRGLAEALQGIPVRQYRCGGDPVPYWPDAPYVDVVPLHQIGTGLLNPLSDHAIGRYVEELARGGQTA